MNARTTSLLETGFLIAWIVIGLLGYQILGRARGETFKTRWMFGFNAIAAALFLPLVVLSPRPWRSLVFGAAAALVVCIGTRRTRFCRSCGATIADRDRSKPMQICPLCGAKFVELNGH